jgi:apolipoprotein N-acyltransferase
LWLVAAAPCLGLLSFSPFPFRFLAFFALVPLLWITVRATPGRAFLWGWLFGGLAFGCHLFWLWFLVVPVVPVTRVLLDIGVVLLFAYLGLYVGVFSWLVRRWGLWAAPFLWPLLEFVRTKSQIGFPWGLLGYTMTPWWPLTQLASVGGVYLLSAWVVLVNVLLLTVLNPSRAQAQAQAQARTSLLELGLPRLGFLALAFAVPLLFALVHVRPLQPWFNVGIVQPNVSPLDKGDWDSRVTIQKDLIRLTREAAGGRNQGFKGSSPDTGILDSSNPGILRRPDLILYPETATLVDVTRSSSIGPAIRGLADSLGTEIFTGTPLYDDRHGTWHNGAVLIRPGEDSIRQRYYKMRLVPFSEKIPYSDEVPLIRKILETADMGNWDRGHYFTVFHWAKGTLSALICYEAIFPDLTREFCRRGSNLLAVVTNDGWFGRVLGARQHAEMAVMRTVENGVPMIRSANNGISLIADPYGRVLKHTSLFTQTVLSGQVPQALPATPYRRWGDWFMLVALLALVGGLVGRLVLRRPVAQRR